MLRLALLLAMVGADPSAKESFDIDEADRLSGLYRYAEAERLLRSLTSPLAKATRATLIGKDDPEFRRFGLTSFDTAEGERLSKRALPALVAQARTDARAARILGLLYSRGIGVAEDPKKAFQWFRFAASRGNPRAACGLAICYAQGYGTGKNPAEAAATAKKAAEGDYAPGCYVLGCLYEEGIGVPKVRALASSCFSKAARGGHLKAMAACADFALERFESAVDSNDFKAAEVWYDACDNFLRDASEAGDAESMIRLAMLERIRSVKPDPKVIFPLYRKAAQSGLSLALLNLAGCYAEGKLCEKDLAKVSRFIEESLTASKRDSDAQGQEDAERLLSVSDPNERASELLSLLGWDSIKPVDVGLLEFNFKIPKRGSIRALPDSSENAAASSRSGAGEFSLPSDGSDPSVVHYCGAPTLDGTPCMRLVRGPGYCWQHGGQ